ncbi:MAG: hypothetical protein KDA45_02815, partial [Planctomycetales bacterium]|nr:hypothetical protein [Planctomycetales bacterium]
RFHGRRAPIRHSTHWQSHFKPLMVLKPLAEYLQLDRALVYAMAARVWQALSGPITIIFLVRSLSLSEQGIYYAIANILGLQMFFELGLLNILVSQAGHQLATLTTAAGQQRMRELIRSAQRWFGGASILFALSALGVGWDTLLRAEVEAHTGLDWELPLLAIVIAAAGTVALSPALAILEGAGYREDVYRIRLLQMFSGSLVVWIALSLGLKLWALVLSAAVQFLWSGYLAWIYRGSFFGKFRQLPPAPSGGDEGLFSWSRDVLPVQWRYALISGIYHLATQFFILILTRYHSPAEAGRLGMTLSVTAAIQALALAWVNTKFSIVSAHHGAGRREVAGTLWRHTAVVSTGLLVLGMSAAGCVIALLPLAGLGLENRFIAPWQFAILAVGCLANHGIALQGFYVLSRGARPLLVASLIGYTAIAIAVWGGGYLFATYGILLGYTLTMSLVALPLHTAAYLHFRRVGQAPS